MTLSEEILAHVLTKFYADSRTPLAAFHAKFIVEHVVAACKYDGVPPRLTLDRVKDALQNLLIVEPATTQE